MPRPNPLADGGASTCFTPRPPPLDREEGGGGLPTIVDLAMAASMSAVVDLAMAAATPVNPSFSSSDIISWRASSSSYSELVSAAAGAVVDGADSGYAAASGTSTGGTYSPTGLYRMSQ